MGSWTTSKFLLRVEVCLLSCGDTSAGKRAMVAKLLSADEAVALIADGAVVKMHPAT